MSSNSLNKLISSAAERLHKVGIEAGLIEVEIILCHLLQCERLELYLAGGELLTSAMLARLEEIVAKRETRYPLQFILGEAYFYGRRFSVNESVMAPTPETELLCENALRYFRFLGKAHPRALDVGTGSGVIAVTVALECPEAEITALDISSEALTVAKENARALGAERINFERSDLFAALPTGERFDLIMSNPPYISDKEYPGLPPEVKADPKVSLTSGEEGLDIIKRLLAEAPTWLTTGGKMMFEIGYDQGEVIGRMVENDSNYKSHVLMRDLNDIDRLVIVGV